MKKCTKCGIEKPIDSFTKSTQAKGGRTRICKKCNAIYAVARREKNNERQRELGRARWKRIKSDPVKHEKHKAATNKYRENPEVRKIHNEKCLERSTRLRADPIEKEKAKIRYEKKRLDPEYREKQNEKARAYRAKNPERQIAATKRWYEKKKQDKEWVDSFNKNQRESYASGGKRKETALKCSAAWRKANPQAKLHSNKLRKTVKDQRTPKWANLDEIKQIFLNCPEGMHVDHIIPLRGKLVSGLHVAGNLQYLTPTQNISKNNRFDVWNFVGP